MSTITSLEMLQMGSIVTIISEYSEKLQHNGILSQETHKNYFKTVTFLILINAPALVNVSYFYSRNNVILPHQPMFSSGYKRELHGFIFSFPEDAALQMEPTLKRKNLLLEEQILSWKR